MKQKAQVTIFIILAIVIVSGIILYLVIQPTIVNQTVPAEFESVYNYYLDCISENTIVATQILGGQGGYIELPQFEGGSEHMPFSNYLNNLGTAIPYWYYISGNGVVKQQIPSKEKVTTELENFLETQIAQCDFTQFETEYLVNTTYPDIDATIENNEIKLTILAPLRLSKNEETWFVDTHSVTVQNNLGTFYDTAKKIYDYQNEHAFLEHYGEDILRLYAPVEGSEIGCGTKTWSLYDIREDLIAALQVNVPLTKVAGNYYTLSNEANKYYITDIGEDIDLNVQFSYDQNWPLLLNGYPNEQGILRADPIGLQEGMGLLGFCYTPYHFVYDFAYPVLIQLHQGSELFQFPVVVHINKNLPRTPAEGASAQADVLPELCKHKGTNVTVSTFDSTLNPVNAALYFNCFDDTCAIGNTEGEESTATVSVPQCINGYIIAQAQGYETGRVQLTTLTDQSSSIILQQQYTVGIEIEKGNRPTNDLTVVTFENGESTYTLAYPEQRDISLVPGTYDVTAYSYSQSSIKLSGTNKQHCVEIPKTGALGVFGATEEKCFDMQIPSQDVSIAVSGGGTTQEIISEGQLRSATSIILDLTEFDTPSTVEELQINFNAAEVADMGVRIA